MSRELWLPPLGIGIEHTEKRIAEHYADCATARTAFVPCGHGQHLSPGRYKQFREEAEVVRRTGQKVGTETRTLLDWFTDFFKYHADARDTLEQVSASVFDVTSALFSAKSLSRVAPNFKRMLEQVAAWKMLKPMEAPVPAIHDHLYWELSKDAHLIPDKTLMGRRFIGEKRTHSH